MARIIENDGVTHATCQQVREQLLAYDVALSAAKEVELFQQLAG